MTTVDQIRQRLELEYLEPVTESSPSVPITTTMTDATLTVTITDGILSPDEEAILGPGALVEINNELLFVSAFNASTQTLTFPSRGHADSAAAAHAIGDFLRFPTRWPRYLQVAAVRDAISGLYPPLFVVKEHRIPTGAVGFLDLELETVEVHRVQVQARNFSARDSVGPMSWYDIEAESYQTHPLDDGMAYIRLETGVPDALAIVGYGVRIALPTLDTDTIVDLPQKWERLILVDAALSLLSGVDIDAVTQEYLTQSLRLERFPVRSGESITRSLIAYREYLINRFENEQLSQTPPPVVRGDIILLD